MERIKKEAAVV